MNPQNEIVNYESTTVGLPGRHVREEVVLGAIDVTVDRYGQAYTTTTGVSISQSPLSQQNVEVLERWQDSIATHESSEHDNHLVEPSFFDDVLKDEYEVARRPKARERVGLVSRVRRVVGRSRAEVYYLPHSAMEIAARGLARVSSKADVAPTNAQPSRTKRAFAWAVTGAAVTGLIASRATAAYASTKYGIGGGSFEAHGPLTDVLRQHLGQAAVGGVLQHKQGFSGPSQHEIATLSFDGSSSNGKQDVSQLPYNPAIQPVKDTTGNQLNGPAKHSVSQLPFSNGDNHSQPLHATQLDGPGKHSVSQLPYNPRVQPEHVPQSHLHRGHLSKEVFVEHGHGITQEYVDIAQHNGFTMTGEESYRAYNYVNDHVHGHFFTNDKMYRLPNGDWGISHPGMARWTPDERHWFHQWLIENDKLTKKTTRS